MFTTYYFFTKPMNGLDRQLKKYFIVKQPIFLFCTHATTARAVLSVFCGRVELFKFFYSFDMQTFDSTIVCCFLCMTCPIR